MSHKLLIKLFSLRFYEGWWRHVGQSAMLPFDRPYIRSTKKKRFLFIHAGENRWDEIRKHWINSTTRSGYASQNIRFTFQTNDLLWNLQVHRTSLASYHTKRYTVSCSRVITLDFLSYLFSNLLQTFSVYDSLLYVQCSTTFYFTKFGMESTINVNNKPPFGVRFAKIRIYFLTWLLINGISNTNVYLDSRIR